MQSNDLSIKSFLRCVSFSTAASYDLLGLALYFKKKGYLTKLSRDMLHISNHKKPGDVFFFNYGSLVSWGFKKHFENKLIEITKLFSTQPLITIETDYFYYRYNDATTIDTHERLRIDVITLDNEDMQVKLAISYALAQSIKLEAFEEAIKEVIKKNNSLPEEIATKGTISLSRRAIFKRIGEIFLARSSINLNIEYLDTPEFFWRNPNLESYYVMTKKFLDIPSRVMSLNQKLDVLQELLDILNTQVHHRYTSFLESIIIILIAIEIIISLYQFYVF